MIGFKVWTKAEPEQFLRKTSRYCLHKGKYARKRSYLTCEDCLRSRKKSIQQPMNKRRSKTAPRRKKRRNVLSKCKQTEMSAKSSEATRESGTAIGVGGSETLVDKHFFRASCFFFILRAFFQRSFVTCNKAKSFKTT